MPPRDDDETEVNPAHGSPGDPSESDTVSSEHDPEQSRHSDRHDRTQQHDSGGSDPGSTAATDHQSWSGPPSSPESGLHEGSRLPPERASRSGGEPRRRQSSPTDPVQDSFAGSRDLYEIATWEARTPFDRFAVRLTNTLESTKRALLLSIAVTLFLGQIAVATILVVEEPIIGVLGVISALPALALAGYFWYGDPTTREPFVGLAVTFLLAIAFASIAGVVNTATEPFFQLFGVFGITLFYFLIVGPIEETVKWLAVRVYAYRTAAFQTVIDGVVYGAMAGVGFAAIENLIYIIIFAVEMTPSGIAVQQEEAISVATQRAFVGPGHVIFSAWAGFYLGLAKFNQGKRGPIVVKGLLIASLIHGLYNTLVTTIPLTLMTFIIFIFVFHGFWFVLLYRKIRRYRSLYVDRERTT